MFDNHRTESLLNWLWIHTHTHTYSKCGALEFGHSKNAGNLAENATSPYRRCRKGNRRDFAGQCLIDSAEICMCSVNATFRRIYNGAKPCQLLRASSTKYSQTHTSTLTSTLTTPHKSLQIPCIRYAKLQTCELSAEVPNLACLVHRLSPRTRTTKLHGMSRCL